MSSAVSGSLGIAGYLALFAGVGLVFVFVNLLIGRFVRPSNPHPEKLEIYECGEPTIGSSFVQFDLRFYVIALIFIVFDVEVAFLFPWATVFGKAQLMANAASVASDQTATNDTTVGLLRELGASSAETPSADPAATIAGAGTLLKVASLEMLVFFVILLVGYAYVWRVGALDWVRALADQRPTHERGSGRLSPAPPHVGIRESALSA